MISSLDNYSTNHLLNVLLVYILKAYLSLNWLYYLYADRVDSNLTLKI